MKIIITADPEIPVPPQNYGGIERIVDGLITELDKQGHEIILIANEHSTCLRAKKIIGWKGKTSQSLKSIFLNAWQLFWICKKEKPDLVHSYSRLLYLYPLFLFSKTKIIQSYQRKISKMSTKAATFLSRKKIKFTACASHMYQHLPNQTDWSTIYNFTDTTFFTPSQNDKPNYLYFLGRIEDIKGTKEAIQVAKMSNKRLIIAGNIEKEHEQYFNNEIKPELVPGQIEYVGSVDDKEKRSYFRKSKAFLFPIKWDEPFGIVMAEAMACGTPVIAFKRGSVPEVIQNGMNGFICKDIPDMVESIKHIDKIDREKVRSIAQSKYSSAVVAQQYINLYLSQVRS